MYRNFVKISLILVYLVIIAGAVVRMTGSGMGCPDWPKCFGYYIPPHEISELQFSPNHEFKKGQVIIEDEQLLVATSTFTTKNTLDPTNWEVYTKHDYAIFNPWHTWIEYINRLAGALAGIAVLIMAILSLKFWKRQKRITILSWLSVFLMGFQGWLGATVVYSVLSPVRITIHMVVALVIVALLLYLLQLISSSNKTRVITTNFRNLLVVSILLTLVQIVMGTQVRQLVDDQVKILGENSEQLWLANPSVTFYVHRSFSILILLINAFLWWQNRKLTLGFSKINWVMGFIFIEIITGVAMYNFHFPFLSQPLHLVIASILFGIQFYILLEAISTPIKSKSL
ncbi:COX15/CtaA family protein [Gillisia sp. M10.2A]|uniref:COX15/CtaA family protein n=1 Tax=Gillisia lutea TaxID=2909668 RepID=A0ABS9EEM3_9FLAO|nr:COX15/CtaA family protein [Gillisia lutea]MCF4101329.1 COX15/CtaA family protein [Gillisia lutea]